MVLMKESGGTYHTAEVMYTVEGQSIDRRGLSWRPHLFITAPAEA